MDWSLSKKQVESHVNSALRDCRTIKRLVEAMSEAGCPINRDYFKVMDCDTKTGGGFTLDQGVSEQGVIDATRG